jgi:5'-nucleotidase
MHILVTNDDGVMAPGLLALAQAMQSFGQVSVVAPDHNWSISGHVKTLNRPLRVVEATLADGTPALASDGAPSDCVALAVLGLLPEPIDFVVSGINPVPNLGHDLTYSGTVTAAMEAAIWGLPAVAFSLDGPEGEHMSVIDYSPAARVAAEVVSLALKHGIASQTLLSVNIPYRPYEQLHGFQVTRQGLRIYRDALIKRTDPRGKPYYWIGGDAPTGVPEEGTDIGALQAGLVSITPVQLDLTAHQLVADIAAWEWSLAEAPAAPGKDGSA